MPGRRIRLEAFKPTVEREISGVNTRRGVRYILGPRQARPDRPNRPNSATTGTPPRLVPAGLSQSSRGLPTTLPLQEFEHSQFTFTATLPQKTRLVSHREFSAGLRLGA